jgi:transcriptional regulator with XRE-family HTH domain
MNRVELDHLLDRLRAIPYSAQRIAQETGLTQEWIAKLRNGKIAEPGVLKICAIKNFVHQYESRIRGGDHEERLNDAGV